MTTREQPASRPTAAAAALFDEVLFLLRKFGGIVAGASFDVDVEAAGARLDASQKQQLRTLILRVILPAVVCIVAIPLGHARASGSATVGVAFTIVFINNVGKTECIASGAWYLHLREAMSSLSDEDASAIRRQVYLHPMAITYKIFKNKPRLVTLLGKSLASAWVLGVLPAVLLHPRSILFWFCLVLAAVRSLLLHPY